MSWVGYALLGILFSGFSDLFRKISASLDPLFANVLFQVGFLTTAVIMFFLLQGKTAGSSKGIFAGLIGGILISIFFVL